MFPKGSSFTVVQCRADHLSGTFLTALTCRWDVWPSGRQGNRGVAEQTNNLNQATPYPPLARGVGRGGKVADFCVQTRSGRGVRTAPAFEAPAPAAGAALTFGSAACLLAVARRRPASVSERGAKGAGGGASWEPSLLGRTSERHRRQPGFSHRQT